MEKTYTITINGINKQEVEELVAQAMGYEPKIMGDVEKTTTLTKIEDMQDGVQYFAVDDGREITTEYFITGAGASTTDEDGNVLTGAPVEVKYTVQEEIDNPMSKADLAHKVLGEVLFNKFAELKKTIAERQLREQLENERGDMTLDTV